MRFYKVIALLIFFFTACVKSSGDNKPNVVVTTGFIADIVKVVGGEFVSVSALVPTGSDPHTYKPNEGDVIRLASADIFFYNGLNLEEVLADLIGKAGKNMAVIPISDNIPRPLLIELDEGYDPHIWFDPELWIYAVSTVADGLISIDPGNAMYYRKNEETFIADIIDMDKTIAELLNSVDEDRRIIVLPHNAFSYFARRYGWRVEAIKGVSTADEVSVNDIKRLSDKISESSAICMFTENTSSNRLVEVLKATSGTAGAELEAAGFLYLDSLGYEEDADTYLEAFLLNVKKIIQCANKELR
jgi:manganese/zinc/iron transport system substrate-binding protein